MPQSGHGVATEIEQAQLPSLKDVTDDELEAWLMRKVFVSGRNDQARALYLLNVIRSLFIGLNTLNEFERILALGSVERLFNCIQRDDHKLDTAKFVLDTMRANIKLSGGGGNCDQQLQITNRKVINFLLKLFQIVNDTLSPLADQDELGHLGHLLVFYVELTAIYDINERLDFYSRCRSCVCNLHVVLEHLIRRVLELPEAFKRIETKRSARQNFLNGCLAFALATIPALYDSLELQLDLAQLGCELALKRSSLSLANYYLRHILVTAKSLTANSLLEDPGRVSGSFKEATEKRLVALVELFLKHQDRIDLEHKIALAKLIKSLFSKSSSLLQSLKYLNCVELIDYNDKDCGSNNNDDDSI